VQVRAGQAAKLLLLNILKYNGKQGIQGFDWALLENVRRALF
jgi:hypothetical protein